MLYKSSKGDREISDMPLPYAANALGKLLRTEPHRTAEIEALSAHVDTLKAALEDGDADTNPRAMIGGNNPPEAMTGFDRFEARAKELADGVAADQPSGRDAVDAHVADLLTEAGNWADGIALADQGQADTVARLHRMMQEASSLVDQQATKEKKPHNDEITKIATWQNGYTAKGLKKTPDGRLTKALTATSNLSAGWLRKQDAERREREKIAADLALKAAQEAVALREEARVSTDIAVMDRAEDALADAKMLLGAADGLSKQRVRSGGGDGMRAMTLRSVWSARISDAPGSFAAAYGHYKNYPGFMEEFHALITRWAERDAKVEACRSRGVPGVIFTEDKVAA